MNLREIPQNEEVVKLTFERATELEEIALQEFGDKAGPYSLVTKILFRERENSEA